VKQVEVTITLEVDDDFDADRLRQLEDLYLEFANSSPGQLDGIALPPDRFDSQAGDDDPVENLISGVVVHDLSEPDEEPRRCGMD
jgi:hypothetical protein